MRVWPRPAGWDDVMILSAADMVSAYIIHIPPSSLIVLPMLNFKDEISTWKLSDGIYLPGERGGTEQGKNKALDARWA